MWIPQLGRKLYDRSVYVPIALIVKQVVSIGHVLWATWEDNTNKKGVYLGKSSLIKLHQTYMCNPVELRIIDLYNLLWSFGEVLMLGIDGTGSGPYVQIHICRRGLLWEAITQVYQVCKSFSKK